MKKIAILMALVLVLTFGCGSVFGQEKESAHTISGTLTLTTNYMFRGYSLSNNNPAIQGSFDYSHASGFYAGVWGSSWDGEEIDSQLEIDWYAGYANTLGGLDYDLMVIYYSYPGHDPDLLGVDTANYWELHIGLGYGFDVALKPYIGVNYDYSPDYYAEDGAASHFNVSLKLSLPLEIGLGAEYGIQDIEGDMYSGPDGLDYTYWRAGLTYTLMNFDLDLSYYGADDDLKEWLGPEFEGLAEDKVVFSVSRTF